MDAQAKPRLRRRAVLERLEHSLGTLFLHIRSYNVPQFCGNKTRGRKFRVDKISISRLDLSNYPILGNLDEILPEESIPARKTNVN